MQQINHSHLASKNPKLEQQELYAYGIRYRLKNGLATQAEIKAELSKRSDEKQIRQILERLKND